MSFVSLDPPASAVVWLLQFNGYRVSVEPDGDGYRATASHATEPSQVATAPEPSQGGCSANAAICLLAELCGMELEDG